MTTTLPQLAWASLVSCVMCLGLGCATTTQRGAWIGAGTGAALGAGTGLLVSEPELLGVRETKRKGDVTLEVGPAMLTGALVGAVFGATLGAMVGKSNERGGDADAEPADAARHAAATPRAF
jgi:hypothetical protein